MIQIMKQFIWILPVWGLGMLYAWTSYKHKINAGNFLFWMWAVNLLPVWVFICHYSNNLIRDGMIYSTTLLVAYVSTMIWMGESKDFSSYQWFGMALALVGYIFIQKG